MAHIKMDGEWIFDNFKPVCRRCGTEAHVTGGKDIGEDIIFFCPSCNAKEGVTTDERDDRQYLKLFDLYVRGGDKASFFSFGNKKKGGVRELLLGITENVLTEYDREHMPTEPEKERGKEADEEADYENMSFIVCLGGTDHEQKWMTVREIIALAKQMEPMKIPPGSSDPNIATG